MNETPDWLTTGRAIPIIKGGEKRNDVTNFRAIACLLLMWTMFFGKLVEELHDHLENERLLP